jgi:hypothetical protein
MEWLIMVLLFALGIIGVALHVKASLAKGPFVGTINEFMFVLGTALALVCLPAALTMAVF